MPSVNWLMHFLVCSSWGMGCGCWVYDFWGWVMLRGCRAALGGYWGWTACVGRCIAVKGKEKPKSAGQAVKDTYLVCYFFSCMTVPSTFTVFFLLKANAMTRGSLDQDVRAERAEANEAGACPQCAHNYVAACPVGWVANQAGSSCEASGDYSGPCPIKLFTSSLSAAEKSQMEERCAVCWPCQNSVSVGRKRNSKNGPIVP